MEERKSEIIERILSEIRFQRIYDFYISYEVDCLGDERKCSSKQWKRLLELHNVSRYSVCKEVVNLLREEMGIDSKDRECNDASFNSVKTQVYDIDNGREPSMYHTLGLKRAIKKYSKIYKPVFGMRYKQLCDKALELSNAINECTDEESIITSENVAREKLQSIKEIENLERIEKLMRANDWKEIDYEEDDYIYNYIANMNDANIVFLYENIDVLMEYYEDIGYMLENLAYAKKEKLCDVIAKLKKKRVQAKLTQCYFDLSRLEYAEDIECADKTRMVAELYDIICCSEYDEGETIPLMYGVGKLNVLKWEMMVLLLSHYGRIPNGKKVADWIAQVQYDIN